MSHHLQELIGETVQAVSALHKPGQELDERHFEGVQMSITFTGGKELEIVACSDLGFPIIQAEVTGGESETKRLRRIETAAREVIQAQVDCAEAAHRGNADLRPLWSATAALRSALERS